MSAALSESLARSRRKRQAIIKAAANPANERITTKKAMIVADKVFERGGDSQDPGVVLGGATIGHLIVERTLGFRQDILVATFDRMVSKQEQSSDSWKRLRHVANVRDRTRIEKTGKHEATGNPAFVAGAINLFGDISVEAIVRGRVLVYLV